MSSRRARPLPLKLSPRARQDFIDILRYTGETWGEGQLAIYRDKIDAALQKISLDPECGHRRDDLPATHLGYLVGSHIIIYRLSPDSVGVGVGVVRILHQRMALVRHI